MNTKSSTNIQVAQIYKFGKKKNPSNSHPAQQTTASIIKGQLGSLKTCSKSH